MRISDWSSDVCSSDLPLRGIEGPEKTLAATETEVPATPFHPPGGPSCPAPATNPFWSNPMAVQKSRLSPSRRGQLRSHDPVTAQHLFTHPTPREPPPPPHVPPHRHYRGQPASVPNAPAGQGPRTNHPPPTAAGGGQPQAHP